MPHILSPLLSYHLWDDYLAAIMKGQALYPFILIMTQISMFTKRSVPFESSAKSAWCEAQMLQLLRRGLWAVVRHSLTVLNQFQNCADDAHNTDGSQKPSTVIGPARCRTPRTKHSHPEALRGWILIIKILKQSCETFKSGDTDWSENSDRSCLSWLAYFAHLRSGVED